MSSVKLSIAAMIVIAITVCAAAAGDHEGETPRVNVLAKNVRLAQNRPAILQAYDNYDINGQNIRVGRTTDIQACSQSCQSDSECRGFSFNKWEKQCALKRAL